MKGRWQDKSVLVLGLGQSGLAMARWLARAGARLTVADSRPTPPGADDLRREQLAARTAFGPFAPSLLDGIETIAISPGLDPRMALVAEARSRGIVVTGEMSLLAQALEDLGARDQSRILAITGTNGKTTTTALAGEMCRAAGRRTQPNHREVRGARSLECAAHRGLGGALAQDHALHEGNEALRREPHLVGADREL